MHLYSNRCVISQCLSYVQKYTDENHFYLRLRDTIVHNSASRADETGGEDSRKSVMSAKIPLFRQQAVDNITNKKYGTVILTRVTNHSIFTCAFSVLALLLILFFVFFETTRKASVQGILVPTAGVIRVFSSQAGVIKEIRFKEGQFVRVGDILFVVSSERGTFGRRSAEALVSELLVQRRNSFYAELKQMRMQLRQRRVALAQRTLDLQREVEQLDKQALIQQQRIRLSEQTLARFTQLQSTNYISIAQLQEREAELLDQRQRLLEIERIRSATQRDLAGTQAEEEDIMMQALRDENSFRRNASTLEQDLAENAARRETVVRAQQSGTITTIAANLGQTVATTSSLASILPDGSKLEAEMYVPSRAVGFIKPGMTALLRYQAFPYQKFGQHRAHVREVATTSVSPQELSASALTMSSMTQSEPVYRVRLELHQQAVQAYGTAMPLRSGMLVDANVILERRKLYEWVLEPLFSISGR